MEVDAPEKKRERAGSSRELVTQAVFAACIAAALGGLLYYLDKHVPYNDIPGQTLVFTLFALLCAVYATSLGWRYPGDDNTRRWRHVWSVADLVWLLVAVLSFSRVLVPVAHVLQETHRAAEANGDAFKRQDLLLAIWAEKNRNCSTPGPLLAECIQLDRLESRFLLPNDTESMARDLLRQIDAMCGKACSAPVSAVGAKAVKMLADAEVWRKALKDNARQDINLREPAEISVEDTIFWSYATILALTLGFGVRWGRTVAEIRRNIIDERKRRDAKPSA